MDKSELSVPLLQTAESGRQSFGLRLIGYARKLMCAIAYVLAYGLLDWVSYLVAPEKIDITPWNPCVAVSVILLITKGMRCTPLLFIASLASAVFVEGHAFDFYTIAASAGETLIYAGACLFLKERFKIGIQLTALRDVVSFCGVMTVAAFLMGVTYVMTFLWSGAIALQEVPALVAQYWAGDALGILIVAPLFLIHKNKPLTWFRERINVRNILLAIAIFASSALICLLHAKGVHLFYLLFVPVIWAAIRYGFSGVSSTLFLVEAGLIYGAWQFHIPTDSISGFLPFFMLCMSWTGIILGSLMFERESSHSLIMKGNARLKALLDMTPECMVIVDIANKVVAANQNFARLYGVASEQLIGQDIETIIPKFSHTLNSEASIFLADNSIIPVEISTSRVNVGNKFSSILTIRDITNKKNAELQTRQRRAVTEQATRTYLTGSLAAVLAHELNQPLSAIMSYASVCKKALSSDAAESGKAAEQLDKISAQAKRAGDIIRRLREFFQNSSIDIVQVEMLSFIRETLSFLEDEITRTNTAIDVRIVEPLVAAIDRVQVEQVLINLIRNSLEALGTVPPDQRRIRIVACRSMRGDIEVIIHDTGPGIAPEIANQLFSPFVTTRLSGMGLGLTISRSIIEAHNGRLWAELQASSGAALHFTLPEYQGAL